MSKAILVIDMPIQCCDKCKMCYETETDEYICVATDRQIPDGEKPNWCPLREVPQKQEEKCGETIDEVAIGYNTCIDEILEGVEENG